MSKKGNRQIGREGEQYRWKPGQSGNPGGRPKGLAAIIRERTDNGGELVNLWITVMRGGVIEKDGIRYKPTLSDMIKASAELADRGFGKATQPIDLGDENLTGAIIEAARAFTERISSLSTKQEEKRPALKSKS